MSQLKSIWTFLCALFCYLYFVLRFYKLISYIHRRIFDKKYDNVEVSTYSSIKELRNWIKLQTWTADSWDSFFDAVCTPNKVQAVGQGDHKIGDCDEFAIYEVAAIQKSLDSGLMKEDGIQNPKLLTVTWMELPSMKPAGHNVCLLEKIALDGTVYYCFMDYDMPSITLNSIEAIANLVRIKYTANLSSKYPGLDKYFLPLTWAVQKLDLTPVQVKMG